MDEGKGSDLVKTALGVLLLVVGNFLAVRCFPDAPHVRLAANGTPLISPEPGALAMQIAEGYKLMVFSLLILNGGALLLFWGGKKASA